MMPKLDGISATRNIRQYDTWTPIISMTANTTDQDVHEYILSGMTDILPKPLDERTLRKLLERYCAHLKAVRQNYINDLSSLQGNDKGKQSVTLRNDQAASVGPGSMLINFQPSIPSQPTTDQPIAAPPVIISSSFIDSMPSQSIPQATTQQQNTRRWQVFVNSNNNHGNVSAIEEVGETYHSKRARLSPAANTTSATTATTSTD